MARAIWTGSVSFGLVNVPVGLFSATQDHDVHFHQFEKGTSSRIRNQRVNEDTGEEVDYGDVVKGAELRDGGYVLVLETMHFADEVRDPADELDQLPTRTKVAPKDLDMAVSLVKAMTSPWKPKNYRDTYTERVQKLIDAKKKDREIVLPESTEDDDGKVVDLLEALQASLDKSKGHKAGNAHDLAKLRTRKADEGKKQSSGKKSTAKKSTAKKSTVKKATAKKATAKKSAKSRGRRKAS